MTCYVRKFIRYVLKVDCMYFLDSIFCVFKTTVCKNYYFIPLFIDTNTPQKAGSKRYLGQNLQIQNQTLSIVKFEGD